MERDESLNENNNERQSKDKESASKCALKQKECNCAPAKEPSLVILVKWNIKKAMENNPSLELKSALKEAGVQLGNAKNALDINMIKAMERDKRYLACALLAWQQLGNQGSDSLYSFIQKEQREESKRVEVKRMAEQLIEEKRMDGVKTKHKEMKRFEREPIHVGVCMPGHNFRHVTKVNRPDLSNSSSQILIDMPVNNDPSTPPSPRARIVVCPHFRNTFSEYFEDMPISGCHFPKDRNNHTCGLKFPHSTGLTVMRLENPDKINRMGERLQSKIQQACCQERSCMDKLTALENAVRELRARLAKLARREADRVELLERAETAWFDLEAGYMRRHRAVVEKEEDIKKQIRALIEERQNDKEACEKLVEQLKPRGDTAEKARTKLKEIEDKICEDAVERLKQCEMAANADNLLADAHCQRLAQDRDNKFKEEEAIRKLQNKQAELDSKRGLTYEAERAMSAELAGLKNQAKQVAKTYVAEEENIEKIKAEIAELEKEKKGIADDLEGCQATCDANMQKKINSIKEKRAKLDELKKKVLDCKCKVQIEVGVEAKRTPSFAALCDCQPEDRALESCSCTTVNVKLLQDLLKFLFGGLQSEMNDIRLRMPCQLLKCLEDRHNWDKASVVKTNLRNFFCQLLAGELNIAITNSIEKYHAQWVGATCADLCPRPIPDYSALDAEGWEDRAISRKAHQMAIDIADRMLKERMNEMLKQAKAAAMEGPPPCECPPSATCSKGHMAVFHCQFEQKIRKKGGKTASKQDQLMSPTQEFKGLDPNLMINEDSLEDSKLPPQKKITAKTMKKKSAKIVKKRPSANKLSTNAPKTFQKRDYSMGYMNLEDQLNSSEYKGGSQVHDSNMPSVMRAFWKRTQKDGTIINESPVLKKGLAKPKVLKNMEMHSVKPVQRATSPTIISKEIASDHIPIDLKESTGQIEASNIYKSVRYAQENLNHYQCFCGMHGKEPRHFKAHKCQKKRKQKIEESKDMNSIYSLENPVKILSEAYNSFHCAAHPGLSRDKEYFVNTCLHPNKSEVQSVGHKFSSEEYEDKSKFTKAHKPQPIRCTSPTKDGNIKLKDSTKTTAETTLGTDSKKTAKCINCNCFNKFPSTTSVDKLLKTLNKWNDYLNDASYSEVDKNTLNSLDLDAFMSKSTKDVPKKSQKMYDSSKLLCFSDVTNLNTIKCNDSSETFPNDFGRQMPLTESVYIAAVNLEKSNEHFFKNVLSAGNDESIELKFEQPLKCAKSCKCPFNSATRISEIGEDDNPNFKLKENRSTTVMSTYADLNVLSKINNEENIKLKPSCLKAIPFSSDLMHDFSKFEMTKDSKTYNKPCSCGHQIKLLGVTLANTEKQKDSEKSESSVSSSQDPLKKSNDLSIYLKDSEIKGATNLLGRNKTTIHSVESCQEHNNACHHCHAILEELKALCANKNNEQKENKDKGLDTNSFNASLEANSIEKCICCVHTPDEVKNLECNTFQLLEEQLKEKLKDLKSQCKYSCFKPNEEKEAFANLMKKIKQSISNVTCKAMCNCADETEKYEKWQRTFNLLKEYLKIKINRVECLCGPTLSKDKDSVLPDLTEKVCKLIEKDFERIQDICKCKNIINLIDNKSNLSKTSPKITSAFSATSQNLKTISAQIYPENLSKYDDKMKAVETQKSNHGRPVSLVCDILNSDTPVETQCTQYSAKGSINDLHNHSQNSLKVPEINKTSQLPVKEALQFSHENPIIIPVCPNTTNETNSNFDRKLRLSLGSEGLCDFNESDAIVSKFDNNNVFTKVITIESELPSVEESDRESLESDEKNTTPVGEVTYKDSLELKSSFHPNDTKAQMAKDDCHPSEDNKSQSENNSTKKKYVHFPAYETTHPTSSDTFRTCSMKEFIEPDCSCDMVPICHVKMLVDSIESNLINSRCTCDSLSSSVCPVHSFQD